VLPHVVASNAPCVLWEHEVCIPRYFGYICNLEFGGHWKDIIVGVSSLLVLRSNLHGRILALQHFAIYKRVNPLQPLLCALLWVRGLGYNLVSGPFVWINIYLPYIMSRPLKNNQNNMTNQWSNSLLQKITHHSLMLKNSICSTIQRFFFCNWCHTKQIAELIYVSSSKNMIMTSIMQVSNIFQSLLFTMFANKAISNDRCTLCLPTWNLISYEHNWFNWEYHGNVMTPTKNPCPQNGWLV